MGDLCFNLIFSDKVWHKGLIFKLNQNGISDDLLNASADFLSNKKQKVVLNSQR